MSGKPPSTALEALTSEMLGDIGRLHDSLEQLKRDVPAMSKQIEEFLAKLSNGLNSPTLERFINARISEIYTTARLARRDVVNDVETAVSKAVTDGWFSVRKRGEQLFDIAASEFRKNIDDATKAAAEQAAVALAPVLTSLNLEIEELRKTERARRRHYQEHWIGCATACVCVGVVSGALACILMRGILS